MLWLCRGSEGGGHTGQVASSILLPQVREAVSVPIAAAGGFRDGNGLVAALSLGADGIAMGTRFLLTQESPVPDETKQRYLPQRRSRLSSVPRLMVCRNECCSTLS